MRHRVAGQPRVEMGPGTGGRPLLIGLGLATGAAVGLLTSLAGVGLSKQFRRRQRRRAGDPVGRIGGACRDTLEYAPIRPSPVEADLAWLQADLARAELGRVLPLPARLRAWVNPGRLIARHAGGRLTLLRWRSAPRRPAPAAHQR